MKHLLTLSSTAHLPVCRQAGFGESLFRFIGGVGGEANCRLVSFLVFILYFSSSFLIVSFLFCRE
jgi:hypothetical protein